MKTMRPPPEAIWISTSNSALIFATVWLNIVRYFSADCGATSRPSKTACMRIVLIPDSAARLNMVKRWESSLCTPPSEKIPVRCRVDWWILRFSIAPCQALDCQISPVEKAWLILAIPCLMIWPLPSALWPTSEFPIWPAKIPTASPEAWRANFG